MVDAIKGCPSQSHISIHFFSGEYLGTGAYQSAGVVDIGKEDLTDKETSPVVDDTQM